MRKIRNISNQSLTIPFQTPEGVKYIFLIPNKSIEIPDSWTSKIANTLRNRREVRITNLESDLNPELSIEETIKKTRVAFGLDPEGGEPGGGGSGGRPGGGGGAGGGGTTSTATKGYCWEVMVAHISLHVEGKVVEKPFKAPVIEETGKWSTQGLTALNLSRRLGNGRFGMGHKTGANIYKECVCLSPLENTAINGLTASIYGVPYNDGKWKTRKFITKLAKTGFGLAELKFPEAEFEEFEKMGFKAPINHDKDPTKNDQWVATYLTEVCDDCVVPDGIGSNISTGSYCECEDFKNIEIVIDDKTKEYKASDGRVIKLTKPGDRTAVLNEIMEIERAIPLDCLGGGSAS